jgi:hypothetical protein
VESDGRRTKGDAVSSLESVRDGVGPRVGFAGLPVEEGKGKGQARAGKAKRAAAPILLAEKKTKLFSFSDSF